MDAALENDNHSYIQLSNDSAFESLPGNTSSNNTFGYERENSYFIHISKAIHFSTLAICILGLVGNGMVIWLLGFRIKRNPFSTYILNLAAADFGVLVSFPFLIVNNWFISENRFIFLAFNILFQLMYSASQFLLTAISVDRCVAVFFPLWHRCRKPPRLSTIIRALIWLLSFLLSTMTCTLMFLRLSNTNFLFFVSTLLCLPIMAIATVSLLVKVCLKARQPRRGKLLTIILLTLLFALPFNLIFILYVFHYIPAYAAHCALLFACLNSSANPAIYILGGRQWKSRQRETVKMIFQRVFKAEECFNEETSVETQL